jgi:site-specific recombinase XerD
MVRTMIPGVHERPRLAGSYIAEGLANLTSATSKNAHISHLSTYFGYLFKRSLITENPWRGQFVPVERYEADGNTP